MSLLLFFKVSSDITKLPDPRGPQSTTVPLLSIESANAEVKRVIKTEESESSDRQKRGYGTYRYLSWDVTNDYSLSYHCYSERIVIVLHLSYARELFSNSSTPNFLVHVITTDHSLDLICDYIYKSSTVNRYEVDQLIDRAACKS